MARKGRSNSPVYSPISRLSLRRYDAADKHRVVRGRQFVLVEWLQRADCQAEWDRTESEPNENGSGRAFPVAAARAWNTLPAEATSSPSLPTFKRRLKTVLFARNFPDSFGRI